MMMSVTVATIGGVVLLLGLLSGWVRRTWLSEPMLALSVGVALGPVGLGVLDLSAWGEPRAVLLEAARLTLGVGVMGVALRLPRGFFRRRWPALGMMLGPVMAAMWLASGAVVWGLLPVGLWPALLIGGMVTPTDPVLASSILTGGLAERNLRAGVRDVISGESGGNDGLASICVLLPLFVLTTAAPAAGLAGWAGKVLLWEVLGGLAFGLGVGALAGWLMEAAEQHRVIDRTSMLAYSLALTLTVLGLGQLVAVNEILAVFAAGCGFAATISDRDRHRDEHVQEAVNRFFILPVFTLLGAALPWAGWYSLGWAGVGLVGGVLLFRRLPAVWLMRRWIGPFRGTGPALFAGWFGPIGVAALFYAAEASHRVEVPSLWPAVTLLIVSSTVVHGMTATPFIQLYHHWHRSPR